MVRSLYHLIGSHEIIVYQKNATVHYPLSNNIVLIVDSLGNEAAIVVAVPTATEPEQGNKARIIRKIYLSYRFIEPRKNVLY